MSRYFCGAVLVGPDVAHLVGGEDALEDGGVDDRGRHGGSPIVRGSGQCAARARVRAGRRGPPGGRSCGRPAGRRRATAGVGGEHPVAPSATACGVRGQRGVDRPDLGRVDAQLGAEAVPARPGEVGQQPGPVVELGGDPGDRRGQPGAAGRHGQPAGGVGQPVRSASSISRSRSSAKSRVPNTSRVTPSAPRRSRRPPARPRVRSRSAPARRGRRGGAHGGDVCSAVSALGSITAAIPASATAAGRRRASGDPASLIRTDARARSRGVGVGGPGADGRAGGVLGVGGDRVLQVEHDGVGPAGQRLAEPVRPVARDEQVGPGRSAAISDRPRRRAARGSRARRSPARPAPRRCARPAPAPGSIRGSTSQLPGGSSAGTGPADVPTSRQRSRAASCGCSHTSCMVFTRALAIFAASSRSSTCGRGQRGEGVDDELPQRVPLGHPAGVAGEPRVGGQLGPLQHDLAEADPLALVLQAQHHRTAVAGRERAVRVDGGVRGPGPRRRRRAVEGVVERVGRPLGQRLQHRHVDVLARARSASRCSSAARMLV